MYAYPFSFKFASLLFLFWFRFFVWTTSIKPEQLRYLEVIVKVSFFPEDKIKEIRRTMSVEDEVAVIGHLEGNIISVKRKDLLIFLF